MIKATIRFSLRLQRADATGKAPIELTYQIQGERSSYQTGQSIWPHFWDKEKGAAVYHEISKTKAKEIFPGVEYASLPSQRDIVKINDEMAALRIKIGEVEKRLKYEFETAEKGEDKRWGPADVIAAIRAAKSPDIKPRETRESKKHVYDFIEAYIKSNLSTREAGSLSVYKSLASHLKAFEDSTKRKVRFKDMDYSFFEQFQEFLLTPRSRFFPPKSSKPGAVGKSKVVSLTNTTVAKQLSTLKTFIGYARKREVPVSEGYKHFKIELKKNAEVVALTEEEFQSLFNLDLKGDKRLDQVRDIFCFACATGLRYSDMAQLQWEHIKNDEIRITVKKTKEWLTVPLNPYSHAILQKYKGQARPLPSNVGVKTGSLSLFSNQKMNMYLKGWADRDAKTGKTEIHKGLCEIAGINEPTEVVRFKGSKREATIYPKYKLVGVHTGRKTFATLSLEKGMSAEEVMTITGHKDYKSFKRYVKITEKRKKVVMRNAWGEIKKPKSKLKAV
ncbi:MAG TPA: site-specific integrase [Puia sp.]|jgi:integrase|nr:site-specific integrase [Puia sp.]